MDIVSLVLGSIGAVGTVATWIFLYFQNRVNIEFNIIKYAIFESTRPMLSCYFTVANKSRLNLAITSMSVKIDNKVYPCEIVPVKAIENRYKRSDGSEQKEITYTVPFPISISSLSATMGYLHIPFESGVVLDSKVPLTFLIGTNRNKTVQLLKSLDEVPLLHNM